MEFGITVTGTPLPNFGPNRLLRAGHAGAGDLGDDAGERLGAAGGDRLQHHLQAVRADRLHELRQWAQPDLQL